jgi:hypothetical protein
MVTNCPGEISLWEGVIYRVLEQAFQNFKPTQYIFHQHRIVHPLSTSRVWLSLLEIFQQQLEVDRIRRKHQSMEKEYQDDARSGTEKKNDCTYIHARGTQLEHQVEHVPSTPSHEAVVAEYDMPRTRLEDAPEQTVEILLEKEIPSLSNGRKTTTMSRGHVTVT